MECHGEVERRPVSCHGVPWRIWCGNLGNLSTLMECHAELVKGDTLMEYYEELVRVDILVEYHEKSVMVDSLIEYLDETRNRVNNCENGKRSTLFVFADNCYFLAGNRQDLLKLTNGLEWRYEAVFRAATRWRIVCAVSVAHCPFFFSGNIVMASVLTQTAHDLTD